jgi:hypothetical protein
LARKRLATRLRTDALWGSADNDVIIPGGSGTVGGPAPGGSRQGVSSPREFVSRLLAADSIGLSATMIA